MKNSHRAVYEQVVAQVKPTSEIFTWVKENAVRLKWRPVGESESEVSFEVGASFWSWGEKVSVSRKNESIIVRSECSYPFQHFDWGKNRKNVSALVASL